MTTITCDRCKKDITHIREGKTLTVMATSTVIRDFAVSLSNVYDLCSACQDMVRAVVGHHIRNFK